MAYDGIGLKRASARFVRQRERHAGSIEQRRRAIFQEIPELASLDRQLRASVADAAAQCLRTGKDPRRALRAIREKNLSLQARQEQLLAERGYSPKVLEQTPLCSICGDTGWTQRKMCECLKRVYIDEELRLLSEAVDITHQTFDTFSLDWYSEVPPVGRNRSARENMAAVRDMCRMYAERFGCFPVKDLFLTGDPGLGKTFLSACIARTVAERGFWAIYVKAGDLFTAFRDQAYQSDTDGERQAYRYLKCDLLLLDDLGSEWTVPSAQAALYTVVDGRLRKGKCTVISSNLNIEGLASTYSGQTVSRIRGEYRALEFFGEDIRSLRKKRT